MWKVDSKVDNFIREMETIKQINVMEMLKMKQSQKK